MNASDKPRKKWFTFAAILIVVAALITTGVLLTGREADNQDSEASAAAAQVIITDSNLTPSTIKIKAGQSVVWTNQDDTSHLIASEDKSLEGFTSDNHLQQGESFSYVFDKTGTYNYYDTLNPLVLKGEIVVEE